MNAAERIATVVAQSYADSPTGAGNATCYHNKYSLTSSNKLKLLKAATMAIHPVPVIRKT
jgi:hypothetical protein